MLAVAIHHYNECIYDPTDRAHDQGLAPRPRALAVARASDQDLIRRLQSLADIAGLETLCLPPSRARAMDLSGFAVALIVVASSSDLDVALAFGRTLDTIVLAQIPNDDDARYALSAGALGYMAFSLPDTTLSHAIRRILSGDAGFSRSVLGQWLRDIGREHRRATEPTLSARQREILERISHGDTDKEIAHRLGIATATVHKHVQRLLERLDAPNRAAAVTRTRRSTREVTDHARPSRTMSSSGA